MIGGHRVTRSGVTPLTRRLANADNYLSRCVVPQTPSTTSRSSHVKTALARLDVVGRDDDVEVVLSLIACYDSREGVDRR